MWQAIGQMIEELKRCESAGAQVAAVALVYVYIDTLAFLAMPEGQDRQTRSDFIAWVNAYLRGHPNQPYKYRGIDVYGARCAVLHSYGTEADFHARNPDARRFGYSDGGLRAFAPTIDKNLVIIGIPSFINDMLHAMAKSIQACKNDPALRARAEKRLPTVLTTLPFSINSETKSP
jgi:hypothetical protein